MRPELEPVRASLSAVTPASGYAAELARRNDARNLGSHAAGAATEGVPR